MPARSRPAATRFWLLFFGSAVLIGGLGVVHHPAYQEWAVRRLPVKALVEAAAQHEVDDRWLYYTGLRLNEASRYAEALPLLQQAARLSPESARIRSEWTRAQLAQGRFGEDFAQLKQFGDAQPQSPTAHLLLGRFFLSLNNRKRAQEELGQAVRLDPRLAEAWSALASARAQHTEDFPKAAEAAEKAVALAPNDVESLLQLAFLKGQQGGGEAKRLYQRALEIAPDRPDVLRQYADFLLRADSPADAAKAEALAQRALDKEPDAPLGHLALGKARALQGKWQEAVAPLLKAAALQPNKPEPALLLAQAYGALKLTGEKKRWQQEYTARQAYQGKQRLLASDISVHPNDRTLLAKMAHLLGTHGDVNEAVRYSALSLREGQDSPAVLTFVAQDLLRGGYALPALTLARRALEVAPNEAAAQQLLRQAQRASPTAPP